jgi:A/G-specific adenine glycosylase
MITSNFSIKTINNIHFSIEGYQERLLSWFDKKGRHDLPWQGKFDPYKVWLSEIMLQQTQVKTVIPYFKNFIEQFPTLESLAHASEDTLLLYWAGLGYYARLRNLHKAAKLVLADHNAIIPNQYSQLIVLPGIGRSTANAILSIAFNQKSPILDGNVKRVFSRIFAVDDYVTKNYVEKILWEIAELLMPKKRTQAYTQAQMDLGATCCTRTKPLCKSCPHQTICLANKYNTQLNYPIKKPRKIKCSKNTVYYLYRYDDKVYLQKNNTVRIWYHLYLLPSSDLRVGKYQKLLVKNKKHSFTHYDLFYDVKLYHLNQSEFNAMVSNQSTENNVIGIWTTLDKLKNYALPSPISSVLTSLST